MKNFLINIFIIYILLGVWCYYVQYNKFGDDNRTIIRWVTDNNPARREQIALFERLNPDIKVKLDPGGGHKLLIQCAAGVGPDIFDVTSPQVKRYATLGMLYNLSPLCKRDKISHFNFWESIRKSNGLSLINKDSSDNANEYDKYNIYAFPHSIGTNIIVLNLDIFKNVNRMRVKSGMKKLELPWDGWTWWDYLEYAKAMTKKAENNIGYERFGSFDLNLKNLMLQAGTTEFDQENKIIVLDEEKACIAYNFQKSLSSKYHVAPSQEDFAGMTAGGGWGKGSLGLFIAGKGAMLEIGRWILVKLRNEAKFKYTFCPMPRYVPEEEWKRWAKYPQIIKNHTLRDGEWGETSTNGLCKGRGKTVHSRVACMFAGTKHPEASWKFMKYIAGKPYNDLINKSGDNYSGVEKYARNYMNNKDCDYPDEFKMNQVYKKDMKYSIAAEFPTGWIPEVQSRIYAYWDSMISNNLIDIKQGVKSIKNELQKALEAQQEKEKYFKKKSYKIDSLIMSIFVCFLIAVVAVRYKLRSRNEVNKSN